MGGAGSQCGWLRGPRCLRHGVVLLVDQGQGPGGPKASEILLVFGLVPHMADCGAMVVLDLMSAGWLVGLGPRGHQG